MSEPKESKNTAPTNSKPPVTVNLTDRDWRYGNYHGDQGGYHD